MRCSKYVIKRNFVEFTKNQANGALGNLEGNGDGMMNKSEEIRVFRISVIVVDFGQLFDQNVNN